MPQPIRESRKLVAEAVADEPGIFDIQLITPGWGSSGYYSSDVLEKAAVESVFPAGLHMYIDHPSASEKDERPERSIRDIGAVLQEDAYFDGTGLRGKAKVIQPYREMLEALAPSIGVSIRASAEMSEGEAEGRKGQIVESIVYGASADFVTRAGRGGSILQVLESARPSRVNGRAVSAGVTEATANDTRTALQSALTDRFGAKDTYIWVQDFDPDYVWYEVCADASDDTFQLGYSVDSAGVATLADGAPSQVQVRTTYVPVGSADGDSSNSQESREDHMAKIEIDEAEHSRLVSESAQLAEARAATAKAEAELAESRKASKVSEARTKARPAAVAVLAGSTLAASTQTRVVEACVAGLTVADDGTFDEAVFKTTVEAARKAAETEHAEILEAAGVGRVSGNGSGTAAVTTEATEAAARLAATFQRDFGMTEEAAKLAAAGRA